MANSINHILKPKNKFLVTGSLWIECNGERFLGKGRVELLELIAKTGSINKAAKSMGMSYKKAWQMIKMLNECCANPVVVAQAGGEKGGGSTLTDEAHELIRYHQSLRERFAEFLASESKAFKQRNSGASKK